MRLNISPYRCTDRYVGGYTLIELLAVMVIMAIVAAVVFPSFAPPGRKLRAEAGQVASMLRYLGDTSAARKVNLSVIFNLDKRTVKWDEGKTTKTKNLKGLIGVEVPTRGLVNKGQLMIFFNPAGMSEKITVYLEEDDKKIEVSYNPLSRRTSVHETTDSD